MHLVACSIATLLLAVACGPGPDAPPPWVEAESPDTTPDADDRGFRFGLTLNPSDLTSGELERALDVAREAGANQILSGAVWWHLAREGSGSYDWAALDRLVAGAERRGIRVVLQLSGTPDWVHAEVAAAAETREEAVWHPPRGEDELREWRRFVGDVAERYRGRVSGYEVWNEPNSHRFWRPGPDPREYAVLLETASRAVGREDPDARVLFGGLDRNDVGYLEAYFEAARERAADGDGANHFDALGVHPYSDERSPRVVDEDAVVDGRFGTIDRNFLGLMRLSEALERNGHGDKPIEITEYGFSTTDTWMPAVPDEVRARYLREAYALAHELEEVVGLTWYRFLAQGDSEGWELVRDDWAPTASFEAFRDVASPTARPG